MPEPIHDRTGVGCIRAAALVPGERVDGYRVEYTLGVGGMGIVYAAVHVASRRNVALKVLRNPSGHGPMDGKLGRVRLRREAVALSKVRHAGVPRLYGVGANPRVGPYVVTERIEGVSLARWRASQAPTVGRTLDVLLQVARAVAAVHRAGLVHRDIKPSNVLVEPSGRAVLIDFGLAMRPPTAPGTYGADTGRITDVGTVLGTNGYISPEQILEQTVTFRSDQFSLGVLAFEALCGVRPYEGATAVAYARAVRTGARRPWSAPGATARLQRLVDRMLAPDPEERFADMDAVVREMETVALSLRRSLVRRVAARTRAFFTGKGQGPVAGRARSPAASVLSSAVQSTGQATA